MADFRVDSGELELAVARVESSMESVRAEVAGMLANLGALEGTWTGQAASSFQLVVEDWRGAQARVEESMTLIGGALGTAARSYGAVEQDVAAMFAG